ncbi:membrane integrity-associated transporter subunit PqiC [Xanthobacter dioxanivorans]|uniref:Membrane integrity-associated transporter subunit PqiC n=1 Tax=Xanthobacter dioxanivorans TaxID=2528964 RepID=A0A974SHY3_9HYPH|nr:ABC-type transport auxiliary lipoprotein family protein [Xanthobacter dioxanivorans]QRG05842.1 membrane integrity-associated transporter subunit PqiC [Xanthobacter dioxanivorans]
MNDERRSRAVRAGAIVTCARLALGLGLALALAACGSTPVPTYNLSAPSGFSSGGGGAGQLVVMAPAALAVLNTDKIMVEPGGGQVAYLADAQWSDNLPALIQARTIQAFENGSKLRRVARPGDGVSADTQLVIDIRTFALRITDQGPVGVVELSAKLVGAQSGRILAAQLFKAAVPAASTAGAAATAALNDATDQVLVAMVRWASGKF